MKDYFWINVEQHIDNDLDPVHTGPDPYGHHINLKSLKTSMTLKFVIILQNLVKAYHRKSGIRVNMNVNGPN